MKQIQQNRVAAIARLSGWLSRKRRQIHYPIPLVPSGTPIDKQSGLPEFVKIIYMIGMLILINAITSRLSAQEPTALEAAANLEKILVDSIARSEKSVVAIARVRRPVEGKPAEVRPDPFNRPVRPLNPPLPTDPDFIPNEFATGVVIDAKGLILTAHHVLGDDSDYYVTTAQRKVYKARPIGADPRSDLAVLAVDATDLAPIALGDADTLKKGQIVIALGNPYAIARDGQVCAGWGIVSNLARKPPPADESDSAGKRTLYQYGTLIQTDARLNLGASGGPLLNLKGQMVGLCVALSAVAGYETAAGYAIPVDRTFRRAVDALRQGREVEYGFLGVQPVNLRPSDLAVGLHGMKIDRVLASTPAERSGLRPDDVVTAVGGAPVHDADGFVLEVGRLPPEGVARLDLVRNGRPQTVEVALAKYPVQGKKIVTQPAPGWRGMHVDFGSMTLEVDPKSSGSLYFHDDGVLVMDVEQGTSAWAAGLRRGMLVTHVGRTAVRTPREFRAAVEGRTGPVDLRLGAGKNQTLTVSGES
jgi:serine protease Do